MSLTAELPQRPRMEISKDLFLEFSERILRSQVKDTFHFLQTFALTQVNLFVSAM